MPATTAFAQLSTGSLSGTVIDAQRAPIPNAEVTYHERRHPRETNRPSPERTDHFHANALLAGTYTVLIVKAGFKQLLVENAPVSVGSDLGLGELQLNIGETSTTITVRSASGLVERTEPQLSQSFGTGQTYLSSRHSGKPRIG